MRTDGVDAREKVKQGVKGRKDKDGGEAVIKVKPLKDAVKELGILKAKADASRDNLNAGIKAVAERSGLLSSVVRKFVMACSGDRGKFDDEKRKVEQLGIAFEEVGYEGEISKAVDESKGAAKQ